jgi:hypothetical protein
VSRYLVYHVEEEQVPDPFDLGVVAIWESHELEAGDGYEQETDEGDMLMFDVRATGRLAWLVLRITGEPPDPSDEDVIGFVEVLPGEEPDHTFARLEERMTGHWLSSEWADAARKSLAERLLGDGDE